MMETTNIKSFSYMEDGTIQHSILEIKETLEKLKSGFYNLKGLRSEYSYVPQLNVVNKNSLFLDCIKYKELEDFCVYLDAFLDEVKKDKIESLGYKHKLGLLLYGKQGTGKTVISSCIAKKIIDEGGLAINIDTSNLSAFPSLLSFLTDLRKVDNRRMVFIFDESESILREYETSLKNFLDGYNSISNSISIFTTNYIDKIPRAIYERPSRIRFSVEVKGISDNVLISSIVEKALGEKPEESVLKKLSGCTIDEIKEYITDRILDITPTNKTKNRPIGFI